MNQRIGNARVPIDDPNLDLQRARCIMPSGALSTEEAASGKDVARKALDDCLVPLRAGDTLVVWRLGRLGRRLPALVNIVAGLEVKGDGFESIAEKIETTSDFFGSGHALAWCGPSTWTIRRA